MIIIRIYKQIMNEEFGMAGQAEQLLNDSYEESSYWLTQEKEAYDQAITLAQEAKQTPAQAKEILERHSFILGKMAELRAKELSHTAVEHHYTQEISAIDSELSKMLAAPDAKPHDDSINEDLDEQFYSQSPIIRFLRSKRRYFQIKKSKLETEPTWSEPEVENNAENNTSPFVKFFDVIKKLIDMSDDVWNALKGFMPQDLANTVGPILTAGVGVVIHFREGYEGLKLALQAYKDEKIGQRKTRIASSVLIFMFAGTGFGLSTALILGAAAGLTIAGTLLMPTLICAFLTGIYALSLWRKGYTFDQAKIAEAKEEANYNHYKATEFENDHRQLNTLKSELTQLNTQKNEFNSRNIEFILQKCTSHQQLDDTEKTTLADYKKLTQQIAIKQNTHAVLLAKMEGIEHRVNFFREERLKAEREVAFGTIEVAASALVAIGTLLGTAALIGAGIASFGALPTAILVTGVLLGFISKYLENKDEKNNFAYSRGIRNWFTKKWEGFKNWIAPEPKNTVKNAASISSVAQPNTPFKGTYADLHLTFSSTTPRSPIPVATEKTPLIDIDSDANNQTSSRPDQAAASAAANDAVSQSVDRIGMALGR